MNKNFLSQKDESIFSNDTHKKSNLFDINKSSDQNTGETNASLKNYNNSICQNITLHVSQNKINSASFSLNLINRQKNKNNFDNKNYTQEIVLHSLNAFKNSKLIPNNENENENANKGIQHIVLKSLKNYKNEDNDKINNDKKENKDYNNNLIFNSSNIIRVIISSEKIIKNFPSEYLNEMICDICLNLYKTEYNLEKIQQKQSNSFKNFQNFLETRNSLFNLIIRLCMNTMISESTIFLTYNIFDRFVSIQSTNNDELLLLLITCFSLAIKYSETSVPNLEELCIVLGQNYSKEQISKCELIVMEKLNYNISIPTIFDLFQFIKATKNLTQKEYYLGMFILEMFVIGGGALKFNPLCIIEAIYLLILETYGKEKRNLNLYCYMTNSNINILKYNEEINNCFLNIKEECLHVKEKNFQHLIKKFSNEKYEKISVDFHLV